jgi:hypothetical protein
MMPPPGAAATPIIQILVAQRVTVAIAVEHPRPVAGIIIIVVPATAEADIDEAAAIIRRIIAIISITIVVSVAVIIVIGAAVARRTIAARSIARSIDPVAVAAAERGDRNCAEREGKRAHVADRHRAIPLSGPSGPVILRAKLYESS